jgi:predicted phage tail protein
MLRTVHLYGHLAAEFGPSFALDIDTPAEAIRALCCQLPRFYHALRKGAYEIVRGESPESGFALSEIELPMVCGADSIHIMPVVEGGNSKGAITAILGIVLIATAFITAGTSLAAFGAAGGVGGSMAGMMGVSTGFMGVTYGQIALMGGALALSGISSLLAPTPQIENYDREEKQTSFLFNGAFPRNEQGGPLPLVYGRWQRVAPIRVSGAITPSNAPEDIYPGTHNIVVTFNPLRSGTASPRSMRVRHGKKATFSIQSVEPYLVGSVTLDGAPWETFNTVDPVSNVVRLETTVSAASAIEVTCVANQAWWDLHYPDYTPPE